MQQNKISQFPISSHLDEICKTLKDSSSHILILTAETAAGKSTVLPLALLEQFNGKMIMTEPRRLAVLGVANRLADLREEKCGEGQIGYKIHLENRVEKNTRLEVVTEGILVRQFQSDPALEDYNLVIIDEFHERSVNTDMAVAFLKEALQLRDDLYVIVMSATINTQKLQEYFSQTGSGSCDSASVPVLQIPGRQFPVTVAYQPDWSVEKAVCSEIEHGDGGNILVFLPGISDIKKAEDGVRSAIKDCIPAGNKELEVCILHSSVSLAEQKKVLAESDKQRIILSSAIAETSVTVPGVTCVIDCGLARVNRMNISTGMANLTTEVESEFSAEQRKGRAGRLKAGRCVRLWSEFDSRIKDFPPEILRADLTELVLECAERGVFTVDGIDWLDKPNDGAWKEAQKLLQWLGMLKEDGHITEKGRVALSLGLHPRLAGIAIEGACSESSRLQVVGSKVEGRRMGEDESLGKFGTWRELIVKYSQYAKSGPDIQKKFIVDVENRLKVLYDNLRTDKSFMDSRESGEHNFPLILAGYPDRIAKRVTAAGHEPAEYQFPSGRKALIYSGPAPEWIVAPEVMAGKSEGTIFEFEEVLDAELMAFMEAGSQRRENVQFLNGKIQKMEEICYGQLVLSSKKIQTGPDDFAAAWVNEIANKGWDVVPSDEKIENFLLRVEFYNQQKADIERATDCGLKAYLCGSAGQWLSSFLGGQTKLTSSIIYDALYWFLDGSKIDGEVPESLQLSNGRRCKVKYERQAEIRPVVEIIIQRIFGCFETPKVCGKNVLLRLLSPASRPLQVTEDLEHFWTGAWVEICKEMKGRYPKHNWDYRVAEKE